MFKPSDATSEDESSSHNDTDAESSSTSHFGGSLLAKPKSVKSSSKSSKAGKALAKKKSNPSAIRSSSKKGKANTASASKRLKLTDSTADYIASLKALSATVICFPSNGSRDRDVASKLNKARTCVDAACSNEPETIALGAEIARVSFFRHLFGELNTREASQPIIEFLDNDLKEQLVSCSKEDVITTVPCLQELHQLV